ncbi:oligopeptide transporter 7 [Selaginella moellendorffii]|nr:oligopeptide transporter 7 [Selaginella moellendorffii]|eukprot:XP_002991411.2 oligopeptide transporter 7 [Selaginella moellendorffii]
MEQQQEDQELPNGSFETTDAKKEAPIPVTAKLVMDVQECSQDDDQSPIEEVRLTVPTTDDTSLPALTFRTWTLGILSCLILSFINMFFSYRRQQLSVSGLTAQIVTLPLGKLMAATLPTQKILVPGLNWGFSLNPGPFNVKEHVLITIFANAGAGGAYAVHIVTSLKAFYNRQDFPFFVGLLVTLTTQIVGFGFAGMFRKFLVEPAHMWWPQNLVQVSLFRTLHEPEKRVKGGLTRINFFTIVFLTSFAYYLLPGYLFATLSSISWVCYIWPKSIIAHQLGSGLAGYGLGAIGLDWSTVAGFLGSPLASPFFAIANTMVGFIVTLYVLAPVAYWGYDMYGAKKFPLLSLQLFDSDGQVYNRTRITTSAFDLDTVAYNNYSRLHISTIFVFTYGISFAMLTASVTHAILFHGKTIWRTLRAMEDARPDIHAKLMRKYKRVPTWWYGSLLVMTIALSVIACEVYNNDLQLRWWGVLFSVGLSFLFCLPIGVLLATTNQSPGLNVISEYLIGYIYPNKPIANVLFKTYGTITVYQTTSLLSDFKIGHYMKIPPRSMFIAQIVGTMLASMTYLGTAWWLLETVPNICNRHIKGNVWTCPGDTIFYDASVIWGLIGPQRIFGDLGLYKSLNWCFLLGAIAPVIHWVLTKVFPTVEWLKYVVVPVLIGGAGAMPYATAVNYWSWFVVGFFFNYFIFRTRKKWWQRHNYILSAALDAGVAFMGVFIYAFLSINSKKVTWWGNVQLDDQCPLATCPTAPGIKVDGCPVH